MRLRREFDQISQTEVENFERIKPPEVSGRECIVDQAFGAASCSEP